MRLLIVDPNFSASSPSMKGVVRSLPALRAAGFEVEAWCWECDPGLGLDRVVRLPRVGAVRGVGTHVFGWWARLWSWWTFSVRRRPRPDVIYTVAWYLPDCDVCHVHFSPWDWERRQRDLGWRGARDLLERVASRLGLGTARRFLARTTARRILCVSDAVADDVRAAARRPSVPARVGVLPNGYDASVFHPGVRGRWRAESRRRFSLDEDDAVFIFVSTGHYRRKGFFFAVEALARLRERHPRARLLVVGGDASRLRRLRRELDGSQPGWREFVTFTGNVNDVERCFAAADALLFPSYSEALALVEVEAAACGLPLFLTRHHGSEMILEDGINGRFLEFDAGSIAELLAEFIRGDWKPRGGGLSRVPDSATYARLLAGELLAVAGAKGVAPAVEAGGSLPVAVVS